MNKLSFEMLSQTADIKHRTNLLVFILCSISFLAGIGLIVYSSSVSEDGLGMTGLFAGTSLSVASIAILFAKHKEWVYCPTGSHLKQKSMEVDAMHLDGVCNTLSHIVPTLSSELDRLDNSRILLECIYSSDGNFAAFQISRFSTLMYSPTMDVCLLSGETAHKFKHWISTEKQVFS